MLRSMRLAFAIALLGPVASCSKDRQADPALASRAAPSAPRSDSALAAIRREPARLARVEVGMTEEHVTKLLGVPDEVRTQDGSPTWIVGARAAWAYGVTAPDGFAFGGLVLFDARHRVMQTLSPIDAVSVRARRLPWSDTAVVNDRGLSCHLVVLRADSTGIDAQVTLKNNGAATFERRHGHTGIAFDLIVELYDPEKHLLARYDTLSLFSPYAPGDTALMTIPSGRSIAAHVRLGAIWSQLGKLPAGRYVVRVAFPFEMGRFSVSEPVAFEIAG